MYLKAVDVEWIHLAGIAPLAGWIERKNEICGLKKVGDFL
jgi:hypothetical protein